MARIFAVAGLAGLLMATVASAQDQSAGATGGGLDLSVRARALGVGAPDPVAGSNLDFETVKAPTGAGTMRMPQLASGRERSGVYVGAVVCDPFGGRVYETRLDEASNLPEPNLRGMPSPRTLYVPGRP
jgi:hypothetical protein